MTLKVNIRGACNSPKVTQSVNRRAGIWAQVCPAPGLFSAQGEPYFPGSFNRALSWTCEESHIIPMTHHCFQTPCSLISLISPCEINRARITVHPGQWRGPETQGGLSVLGERVGNSNSKHFLSTSYLHAWHGEKYSVYISHWVPLKLQEMSAFIISTLHKQELALKY